MVLARIHALLHRHRAGRAVIRFVFNLDRHHAPVAASAMAFDTFLSLVPLTAFAGFVLAELHETADLVVGPIVRAAPIPVRRLVDESLYRLTSSDKAALAPLSMAAFLWVSSAGLSTAMYVFEQIYRSPPRPWWWRRLVAMGCVVGGVSAIAVVLPLSILIAGASGAWGPRLVAFSFPALVIVGMLAAFFRIAIRGARPLGRRILPGVLATTALWSLVSALFSFYVATLSRYTTLYGGLAAVAIFLFWLWLLALALLVGGEINAQLEGIRDGAESYPLPPTIPDRLRAPEPPPELSPSRDAEHEIEAPVTKAPPTEVPATRPSAEPRSAE
jgi:membrane protein